MNIHIYETLKNIPEKCEISACKICKKITYLFNVLPESPPLNIIRLPLLGASSNVRVTMTCSRSDRVLIAIFVINISKGSTEFN